MSYYSATDELISSIQSLSPEVREAVERLDLTIRLSTIGAKHHLLMTEVGEMYAVIRKVLIGETKAIDFGTLLKDRLEEDHKEKLVEIVKDVNENVFIAIREELKKIQTEKANEVEKINNKVDKDTVLSEIENPVPTQTRTYVSNNQNPKPIQEGWRAPTPSLTENAPKIKPNPIIIPTPPTVPVNPVAPVAGGIFQDRLNSMVSIPQKRVVVPPPTPPNSIQPHVDITPPKMYSKDPYRENVE